MDVRDGWIAEPKRHGGALVPVAPGRAQAVQVLPGIKPKLPPEQVRMRKQGCSARRRDAQRRS